ncbi:MAG TPA: histidine phosphatase family protein [Pyrinomonadaceae bacterium]|jgi:phosphohistidine phosphatase
MKTLYLLRHAKSSWSDASLSDFERPLNERGQKAAPLIGELMRERVLKFDVVLCSPAVRARETARLALEAAEIDAEVHFEPRIYEASVGELVEIVSEIDESVGAALLVGHNNALENLLAHLTGDARHMATATLARISLPLERWSEVHGARGTLDWFVRAKDLA